jgi:hypothetical protein
MDRKLKLSESGRVRLIANEALAEADEMTHPHTKRMMVALAASFNRLADHAEKREAQVSDK